MKLEEVLPALKAGKQIKRGNSSYPLDDGNYASPEDLLADDWEIVDPPPQKIEVTKAELRQVILNALHRQPEPAFQMYPQVVKDVCKQLGFRDE